MPVSEKPRKKYKPKDKDPIRLIMERGTHTVKARKLDENGERVYEADEDGVEQQVYVDQPRPLGVVLAPVQTMLVAGTLQSLQKQVQVLTAIIQEHEADTIVVGPTEADEEDAPEDG